MKARTVWISGYRNVVDNCRGHSVVVDLPVEQKGENSGPTPLELAVMALAGCAAIIFEFVAGKQKLEFGNLAIEVEAEKGEKTIERCKGTLRICTNASRGDVEKALKSTLEICPVGILFEKAGVKMEWEIKTESP